MINTDVLRIEQAVGAIVAAAREHQVDLVAIGPEAALVAGAADALEEAGVPTFGPSAAAADSAAMNGT